MVRLLLLLIGTLSASATGRRGGGRHPGASPADDGCGPATAPAGRRPYWAGEAGLAAQQPARGGHGLPWPGTAPPDSWPGDVTAPVRPWPEAAPPPLAPRPAVPPGFRRPRRVRRWLAAGGVLAVSALVFRKVIAAAVLTGLSAALHLVGINVHLPHIRFGWPWQSATAGSTTTTSLGPWILQRIEGISRPALGEANFSFYFTRKVSRSIGPWPCWYSSTFYAVARASATVDLNPGPAWWRPAAGHYRLQIVARPWHGRPGRVTVAMALPRPQLPHAASDVSINNIPSKPIATQHSWTYPGLGCGALLRPQFPESVLYAQAQRIAFYKAGHSPAVTGALIRAAQDQAVLTIRDNFIQPTVNALGYLLGRFTIRWAAGP